MQVDHTLNGFKQQPPRLTFLIVKDASTNMKRKTNMNRLVLTTGLKWVGMKTFCPLVLLFSFKPSSASPLCSLFVFRSWQISLSSSQFRIKLAEKIEIHFYFFVNNFSEFYRQLSGQLSGQPQCNYVENSDYSGVPNKCGALITMQVAGFLRNQ